MIFEKLSRKNVQAYLRIFDSTFRSKADRKLGRRVCKWALDKSYGSFCDRLEEYIVYDRGRTLGITGIYQWKGKHRTCWLSWFGVVPAKRREGYGSRILSWTVARGKRLGYHSFWLYTTSKRAGLFYRKNGFKRSARKPSWEIVSGKKFYKYNPRTVFYSKRL